MKISFLLTTNNNYTIENLTNFFKTVFSYKNENFEVIVVDNYFYDNNFLTLINKYFSLYPKQIQVLTSYRALDIASGRNLAIPYAKGEYLAFVQPTDEIKGDFFPIIEKIIKHKKPHIDCIEYKALYKIKNHKEFESFIRIEENKILNLKDEANKNIFALVSPLLTTKLFNKNVIIENNLKFRKPLQFDTFFLYTFLAHTNHIYAVNKTLISGKVDIIKNDNSFELLSQWIHILNYYNNLKLKKSLNSELEYAYVRYTLYIFLQLIATTKNNSLIQKTYDYIKEHINRRYKNFLKNPYLLNETSKNDPFPAIAKNLSQYLKKYCHDNQIKDDLRYWE